MNFSRNRVLHVDDDPSDSLLLRQACRKVEASFELLSLSEGEAAVAYLSGANGYSDREIHPLPVLVLLDLKMPRMSGFDVLTWIRKHESLKILPVIIFTASNQNEDIKRAYAAGANSYLVKPVGIHTLMEMVRKLDGYWLNLNQGVSL
ncbi:MAG: response regulator receiver protein [Pedosphaera sp.]|nr:response regulator receiver protein [Pedosphaera sp.]